MTQSEARTIETGAYRDDEVATSVVLNRAEVELDDRAVLNQLEAADHVPESDPARGVANGVLFGLAVWAVLILVATAIWFASS